MFGNVYGLDLGTYEIKVYDKKNDTVWKEKNAIAIANKNTVFSVGDSAYEMYDKAPFNINVVFPMKEGVISHFYDMQHLLQNLLKKGRQFSRGSKYIIAVPTDVTEVEKRAFYDLVVHSTAKAKDVRIVERGIADAIGYGLNVKQIPGALIVNMGGDTTEISVLSYGGVVFNKLVKIGGSTFDQSIMTTIRSRNDYLIGKLTAEELRKEFGVGDHREGALMQVAGRNLLTGIPEQKMISALLVRAAIREPLDALTYEIRVMLERTPPEVLRAIQKEGMYLTGGLSNLKGIDSYLETMLGLKVHTKKSPEFSAVEGLKKIIKTKELQKFTYSMLDENYKWMG